MLKKIEQLFQYIDHNFFNILIVLLIVLNISPILAPLLAKMGFVLPAQIIYFIYSFFCHQLDWRSIHVFDYQFAWCVRDTFIWLNMLIAALLAKKWAIKPLKWYWVIPFIMPIAIDGGIQTVATFLGFFDSEPLYISNNFLRMLTGTIFGLGFGLWIMPNIRDNAKQNSPKLNPPWHLSLVIVTVLLLNFVLYLLFVQIWDFTSVKYDPVNIVDLAVKTPANPTDWLIRRKHAV